MKLLLDTHAFVWWATEDDRLSDRARELISSDDNEIFLSAVSAWELAIKAELGRIALRTDPVSLIPELMELNAFQGLPVFVSHALAVRWLPAHHRDPFDRLLVAQAVVEGLTLVTRDPQIARYDTPVVW